VDLLVELVLHHQLMAQQQFALAVVEVVAELVVQVVLEAQAAEETVGVEPQLMVLPEQSTQVGVVEVALLLVVWELQVALVL
jgi:hypothetical protein